MSLAGVRVLDLSRLLPGPFCTMLLAGMGADVIKVEDPEGGDYLRHWPPPAGEMGAMFQALNAGKRSLVLDLKQSDGVAALLRLVETADVVVESFRPGVLERLGAGYDVMRGRNARVILCSITGYGQDGPYRDRAGHDLNYTAVAAAIGEGTSLPPPLQLGDLGGGAYPAVVEILEALYTRERTGEGRHCDIAMLDGLVAWQTGNVARHLAAPGDHTGDILTGRHPCYAIYPCADGRVTVAALEPKFWHEFLDVLGLMHLSDAAFAEGDAAVQAQAEIGAALRTHTRDELRGLFAGRDACVEPVNDIAAMLDDPQVRHRRARIPATTEPAPRQGEHSRLILRRAGYDDATIDALITRGVTR